MFRRKRNWIIFGLIIVVIAMLIGGVGYTQYQKTQAPEETRDPIQKQINHMTLDEKIGQLFVAKTSGVKPKQVEQNVKEYHLGGLLISSDAYYHTNRQQFKKQLAKYQNQAQIPLGLAADQEGGTVSRLDINHKITNVARYPSPMEIYQAGGLKNNVKWAKLTAKNLHELGFNWDFAPVADVATDKNAFIYDRTIGQNYQKTAQYIKKVVPAMQNQGIATSVKHFPGYGNAGDTHDGGATAERTKAQIMREDAVPFKAAVQQHAASIMVTHVVLDKVDPGRPATISKKDINLLRHDLNYNGVIITDSMQMGAMTKYAKAHHINADVAALEAGNDVILSNDFKTSVPKIKQAVRSGKLSEKQIDESVYRVLKMKQTYFKDK
ncbi:beta-N-acetylhexosaminidase [Weissella uvarum]|uniref:glycoside hydrolase family 3 N-terminal domain-containing protein n=1 Tax=Weissella uvarum TaxID=1479233 RepID=UPI0019607018|nr:glycoside hydrolase family 3 N-terminal domain-containing protein [Weissella uvarum]MBM7617608.1 beta-N-acetylhexosaminidase [Weissella uvarum]MCM0595959.1 beta-N-acetylhexosaminidase [Weissella uvarum]